MRLIKRTAPGVIGIILLLVAGCSSQPPKPVMDGAPSSDGFDASKVPDAVPTHHTGSFKHTSYSQDGQTYHPLKSSKGYRKEGIASWYGTKFHGRKTANGEVYSMYSMTAAHKTLPLPSYVRVTNLDNKRSVVVRVNDRGPFHSDRIIDLSWAAAKKLGFADKGTAPVLVVAVEPDQPQKAAAVQPSKPDPGKSELQSPMMVQVAALQSKSAAEQLKGRLQKLSQQPVVISQGDTLYRVRLGPVTTSQELESVKQLLKTHNLGKPLLVQSHSES